MNNERYSDLKNTDINLIPKDGPVTGSYSCTWWNQCSAASALGLTGEALSPWRDALNCEALFDREDLFHPVPSECRSNLIFLLDDGWDVPIGTAGSDNDRHFFGSVNPDKVKFARYGDTPVQRLKGISEAVKALGYAGVGLWISPQEYAEEEYKASSSEEYWSTRAGWCHEAGVLYWKVDWGLYDYDDGYRQLISECAHRCAPGLLVEHAVVQKPLSHNHGDKEKFLSDRAARVRRQMTFCDVNRTYDVLEPFDEVCTLQRIHELLLCADEEPAIPCRGLINAENLYNICAALGCNTGIMNYNEDAKACVLWQRLAPAFGIREGEYQCSEESLTDSRFFASEICEWAPCRALTVEESAPAVMARGCPLPEVSSIGSYAPFVTASKNPKTGAYSVATIRRTVDPNPYMYFLADVTVKDADVSAPVGIFGIFNSLTVEFNAPLPENAKILCQDMLGKSAVDITKLVEIKERSLTLDGKDMRYFGLRERGHNNKSTPSIIIKIVEE